jgi:hypothetical protein
MTDGAKTGMDSFLEAEELASQRRGRRKRTHSTPERIGCKELVSRRSGLIVIANV